MRVYFNESTTIQDNKLKKNVISPNPDNGFLLIVSLEFIKL